MMKSVYFRQAWNLMRQNKVYSVIYVMGTAISVAIIMAVLIFVNMLFAQSYPEQNRYDIYTVDYFGVEPNPQMWEGKSEEYVEAKMKKEREKDIYGIHNMNIHFAEHVLPTLEGAEAVAITSNIVFFPTLRIDKKVTMKKVAMQETNEGFWEVFNFDFIDGKPYTKEDFIKGNRVAVLCESMAKQLFGTAKATGKSFTIDYDEYKVAGVVRDVSIMMQNSFAQVWRPTMNYYLWLESEVGQQSVAEYLNDHLLDQAFIKVHILSHNHLLLTHSIQQYYAEWQKAHPNFLIDPIVPDNDMRKLNRMAEPDDSSSNSSSTSVIEMIAILSVLFLIICIPLIPVFNLISLIDSRLQDRIPEMGVRKVFGARRGGLLLQVLTENLVLTFVGALVGLLMAYCLLWSLGSLITAKFVEVDCDATFLTFEQLVNFDVISAVVILALIINLIVALVPSWLSLRRNIVSSINIKR